MFKQINQSEITDLLSKFKDYKTKHTPYLDTYVGQISKIAIINFDFDESQEEYQYQLQLSITDFKKSWIASDFKAFMEYLNYQHKVPQKDLVIKENSGETKNEYILEWQEKAHQLNIVEDTFTFEAKITTRYKVDFENLGDPLLYKQDTNELLRIAFLKNIINVISNEGIVSLQVQNILLNLEQITSYHLQKITSKYQGTLDQFQVQAFKTALSNNALVVIKGPPGTGKSHLITSLLKHFIFISQKPVIIASQTHAALDNIISSISVTSNKNDAYSGIIFQKSSRGKNNAQFSNWRQMLKRNIYHQLDFHSYPGGEVKKLLASSHMFRHSLNRLIPSSINKIGSSTYFSTIASTSFEFFIKNHEVFKKAILIIDEVSKSSIIDVLRFARYGQKVILVGDDKQLAPIPDDSVITKNFLATLNHKEDQVFQHLFYDSIFEKLFDAQFKDALILKNCYRSSQEIVNLYNDLAYQGQINPRGDSAFFEFKDEGLIVNKLKTIYQKHNLLFFNHQKPSERGNNISEVTFLNNHLKWLNKEIINQQELTVMIIFAYKKAYLHFKNEFSNTLKKMRQLFKKVELGTVDMMQGQEADLVIFLSGYNKSHHSYYNNQNVKYLNILQSLQRINVMLSRTKGKLIIFGNKALMSKIEFWNTTTKERTNQTWKPIIDKFYQINIKHD